MFNTREEVIYSLGPEGRVGTSGVFLTMSFLVCDLHPPRLINRELK